MEVKIPLYPYEFFSFEDGINIPDKKVNEMIKEMVYEMLIDEECKGMSKSTGNTKIYIDREDDFLIVEVYKKYHRGAIDLNDR